MAFFRATRRLFSELKVGELGYRKGTNWLRCPWPGDSAEVLPDQVRVLAETAERAHEIDLERATRAKERAEQRLSKGGSDIDYNRALVALERALIRIQVSRSKERRASEFLASNGAGTTFAQIPSPRLAKSDG